MIGDIGMQELMVIFLIVLLLFGADRIPGLGKGIGQGDTGIQTRREQCEHGNPARD